MYTLERSYSKPSKTFAIRIALELHLEHYKLYISFVLYVSVLLCISFIVLSTNKHTHDELFAKVTV